MAKQDVTIELWYDDQWNDITSDVLTRDGIEISRGYSDEVSALTPGSATLSLKNDGTYSPRNPNSSLHRKIKRNTPLRIRYPDVVTEGFEDASLDITTTDGPGTPNWARTETQAHSGTWSFGTEGVTSGSESAVDITVPDGAGTLIFWAWVEGSDNSTLDVSVDGIEVASAIGEASTPAWEEFSVSVAGATTITFNLDANLATTDAFIDDLVFEDIRFTGEVAQWPQHWDITGNDVWVPIEVSGITRRIGSNRAPLRNAVARRAIEKFNILSLIIGAVGYWPLDDPEGTDRPASGLGDNNPLKFGNFFAGGVTKQRPTFGNGFLGEWLPRSLEAVSGDGESSTGGQFKGTIKQTSGSSVTTLAFDLLVRVGKSDNEDDLPIDFRWQIINNDDILFRVFQSSDFANLNVRVQNLETGSVLDLATFSPGSLWDGDLHHVRMTVTDATWAFELDGAELDSGTWTNPAASLGSPASLQMDWFADPANSYVRPVSIGQLVAWTNVSPTHTAFFGYPGEKPSERIQRIGTEESLTIAIVGDSDAEETLLGPQYPDQLTDIFQEAADTGGGILFETRSNRGYTYRTVGSLYNQAAALTLDYEAFELADHPEPTEDDRFTANDVTAMRRDGGNARSVQATGPLNVNDPTDDVNGIGLYAIEGTINVGSDFQLPNQANWRRHRGTVDESRYPQITVDLDASPSLTDDAAAVDIGDRIVIQNLPAWIPPEDVSQIVVGMSESIGSHSRRITYNCVPESVFHIADAVGEINNRVGFSALWRRDGTVTSIGTAITLRNEEGPDVVHESDFDIMMNGERMTVTAIGSWSGTYPNRLAVFTVTRSVNGVVKSHPDDSQVRLFNRAYIGL